MPGVRTTYPSSSMRMTRRFHRRVSGNWTFTSPISIASEVRELVDSEALLDPFVRVGTYSSSLTGELSAPIMLRRELDVIDDMRRMSREVRDGFLSSGVEETDWTLSSVLEREGGEGRLPGRLSGRDVAWRLDVVDEIDKLRSWGRLAGSIGEISGSGASAISGSTVTGLAWGLTTSVSEGSGPAGTGEISASRTIRAVTEIELAGRAVSTDT